MAIEVHRLPDEALGNSAWLVDLGDGTALAVDPSRDPRPALREADRRGLRIRWVAETHLHADFVSGARELTAALVDVTHLAPAHADLAHPYRPVDDDTRIDLGGLTLQALSTPGHTPEHVAYVLADADVAVAAFTGGTLIVDGVARPDLIAPERTEPLAQAAWRSLTERLLVLPDDVTVYPTHGGGSFCASGASDRPTTTIGEQRRSNPLLQAADEEEFVQMLLAGLGSFPPYFLRLRDVNRQGPRLYGVTTPTLDTLDVDEVARRRDEGAQVVDVRPVDRFAAGHVPGSLSIQLDAQLETWVGWLIEDPATQLIFVVDDDQDRDQLVRRCLKVGYEHLAGTLGGGVAAWRDAGHGLTTTPLTDQPAEGRRVVDVRQRSEWEAGHIDGATHIELGSLPSEAEDLPDEPLITHCVHGLRSMTAASVLERAGHRDVAVFAGGPDEWEQRREADA